MRNHNIRTDNCGVIAGWLTQEIPILAPKTTVRSPLGTRLVARLGGPSLKSISRHPIKGDAAPIGGDEYFYIHPSFNKRP